MTLKIAITVDDIHPANGYGLLLENGPIGHLKKLHDKHGCKFTGYVIPYQEGDDTKHVKNNESWCKKIQELDWLEVGQHGLVHESDNKNYGSQEFAGLKPEDIYQRIDYGKRVLENVGFDVKGFKSPGWYITPEMYQMLDELEFDYVADHFVGNRILEHNGIVKVPYTFCINEMYHTLYDDYMILHSHINPANGNMNGWTKDLYTVVDSYLTYLESEEDVEYVTVEELVNEQKDNS